MTVLTCRTPFDGFSTVARRNHCSKKQHWHAIVGPVTHYSPWYYLSGTKMPLRSTKHCRFLRAWTQGVTDLITYTLQHCPMFAGAQIRHSCQLKLFTCRTKTRNQRRQDNTCGARISVFVECLGRSYQWSLQASRRRCKSILHSRWMG